MTESEPRWELCVAEIRDGEDHRLRAAFVIDGRDYNDPNIFQALYDEAFAELSRRRIVAEFEVTRVTSTSHRYRLPSWEQYRRRFGSEPAATSAEDTD